MIIGLSCIDKALVDLTKVLIEIVETSKCLGSVLNILDLSNNVDGHAFIHSGRSDDTLALGLQMNQAVRELLEAWLGESPFIN